MKVFLVRHGQSQDRVENKKQSPHTPLRALGLAQADAVAKRLQDEEIHIIISSPMNRALQTAQAISSKINIPVTQNILLQEKGAPSIEGVLYADPLHEKFMDQVNKNKLNLDWKFSNEDESFRELLQRATKVKIDLISQYPSQNVLLVTHGFFMMCFISVCILGSDCPDKNVIYFINSLKISNTSISELEYLEEEKIWKFNLLNDHLHIKDL